MVNKVSFIEAQTQLEQLCQQAIETGETITIVRPNEQNVVLLSEAELNSLLETLYVLRSPANASRLFAALERAKTGNFLSETIEALCDKYGLNLEDSDQDEIAAAS